MRISGVPGASCGLGGASARTPSVTVPARAAARRGMRSRCTGRLAGPQPQRQPQRQRGPAQSRHAR